MKRVILMLACAACATNESGNLGATRFGDTSNPAQRGSPVEELHAACGDGRQTAEGAAMRRQPYLQQVTTSSAIIGWVTTDKREERVEVTRPDGTVVGTFPGKTDAVITRKGETQMWASLSGLEPDTVYCYRVANGSPMNEPTGFRTAPMADSTRPIKILAFGDSGGGGSDQQALLKQMFEFPSEMIIHMGDIAYDDGTIDQFEERVFGIYSELFRNLPFFPAPGNHEYNTKDAGPYRSVFALPTGVSDERWYSYDWGRIHFVVLDTEQDYATQAKWLERDLAASTLPFTIVYMHKPMYSSGDHKSDLAARKAFEPILFKHGVQLVLAGHDHHYERVKAQHGIVHFVTGGGGRGTRPTDESDFTAVADEVIHFLYLEVTTDAITVHAIDAEGVEFDSIVIPKAGVQSKRARKPFWLAFQR